MCPASLTSTLRARDVRREPVAVRRRDERVGTTVLEQDGHPDRGHVEAPWLDEREHVVDPAVRRPARARSPAGWRFGDGASPSGPCPPRTSRRCRQGSRSARRQSRCSVVARSRAATARIASSPATAASNSSTLPSVIPASQSSPSASYGAIETSARQRSTRSPSRAAQARACGPPPEPPVTANRSTPRAAAIASMSGTMSATARPGRRVDSPYPGRSKVSRRSPCRA